METELLCKMDMQTDMQSLKFPGPMTFDGDAAHKWTRFKLKFTLYLLDTGNDTASDRHKLALLLSAIGEDGHGIYNSFNLSESEKWNYDLVLNRLEQHCAPKINLTRARYTFFKQKQGAEQSFDSFEKSLHTKAENCAFGFLKESLVKDMIVVGVRDPKLRAKLLEISDLNLTKASLIGQRHETETREDSAAEVSNTEIRTTLSDGSSCYLCSFTGDSPDQVKTHFKQMHEEKAIQVLNFQCLYCGCPKHEELHYHCPLCDVMSTEEQLLTLHALTEHEGVSVVAAASESCSEGGEDSVPTVDEALVFNVTSDQGKLETSNFHTYSISSEIVAASKRKDKFSLRKDHMEPRVKLMRLDSSPKRIPVRELAHGEMHSSIIAHVSEAPSASKGTCTLCSLVASTHYVMKRHFLQSHWNPRVVFGEYILLACKQGCEKIRHYHCHCCTWTGRRHRALKHNQRCKQAKEQQSTKPDQFDQADLTNASCEGQTSQGEASQGEASQRSPTQHDNSP